MMTTDQANAFVETAAIEAAYDAGVEAALGIIEEYLNGDVSEVEADLLQEIALEVSLLHNDGEEVN